MDVNAKTTDGFTALHASVKSHQVQSENHVVGMLFSKSKTNEDADVEYEIANMLLQIAGIDVNATSRKDKTALHIAASSGNSKAVDLLLSHADLNVNACTESGKSALHMCVSKGHVSLVKRFTNHGGIDVNLLTGKGDTALMLAARGGQVSNQ